MTSRDVDIRARLLATFRTEAEEHLQAIRTNLLALERELSPAETAEVAETVFREVHTLKGAARSVSLTEVEALCRAFESVMSRVTRGHLPLTRGVLDRLHEAAEAVARLLAGGEPLGATADLISRLEGVAAEPVTPAPVPASGRVQATAVKPFLAPADTLRLPAGRLDALLLQAEDLLVPKLAALERVRGARSVLDSLVRCRATLRRAQAGRRVGGNDAPEAGLLAGLETDLRAVETEGRALLGRLTRDEQTLARTVDGLLEEMRRVRMTPASTVLDVFPPMVRDLAAAMGKELDWVVRGADLEVDRKVLDLVKDPLIHLVRNAVDHGIETPAARVEAGKPPRGRLAVTVTPLEGHRVEIRVEDDGAGIDLALVRAAAVRARVVTSEQAEALPDQAALDLIYRSGVSTSPIITDLSGHGLGLAIVRERVERLGGQIALETRAGHGTTVRMILPATIATFRGLLVRAGGQSFLLHIDAVERVTRLPHGAIQHVEGRETISWNGDALSAAPLSRLLGLPEPGDASADGGSRPCVIVRSGEERAALLVEGIEGDREVLVKELRPPLVRVRNVAGAGLLGTGEVALLLRPEDLLRSVRGSARPPARPAAPEPARRQAAILVVDDSITTRTMEQNLLEAAGYRVRVAVNGIEAWTLLKSEEFDLVVSDVDMPRMDGFELTRRIRADRKLAELPVVLVTALESREDKERGIEVGANAYVIKSSFDQSNLLEIIGRLV